MKRILLILLSVLLCLALLVGCDEQTTDKGDDTRSSDIETKQEQLFVDSNTVSDTNSDTDTSTDTDTDADIDTDEDTDMDTDTDTDTDTDMSQRTSEMMIEDGYSIVASTTFTIPVTQDKVKTEHTARLAALKKDNGENALYLDVLSEDNTVLDSITWKGFYQLFIKSNGALILMRLSVSPMTQRGTAVCQLFEVSDSKISGYDVIKLESPKINLVAGEGESLTFTVGSEAAVAMYKYHYLNFVSGFQYELEGEVKAGREVYMLAECYLEPSTPTVYSDLAKMPFPDFEDKEIVEKYTFSYAAGLFE